MDKLLLGQRVAQARDDAGVSQDSLGKAVGLDRTAISRLEKGERKLVVTELVKIASILGRPLSYFVSDPVPAVVSRRNDTVHAHATTRALDTELEIFASDVRTVLQMGLIESIDRPANPRIPNNHDAAETAAEGVRRQANLGHGPLEHLGEACERLGLFTFAADLGEHGADGGCVEVDGGSASVGAAVVNGSTAPGRRRMTLAHELGHWVFGDAYDSEASLNSEKMINAFAIHFLAPRAGVTSLWNEHLSWPMRDRALTVAAVFRLSWSAAISQLRNIGLVNHDEHRQLSDNEPRHGDYLRLGLSWCDELEAPYLSPSFVSAVLNAYVDDRLTASRTVELLRETLSIEDLPEQSRPSLDDLRRSFEGYKG